MTPPVVEDRPVVNLLEALKQSVAAAQDGDDKSSGKKMAGSSKKRPREKRVAK